MDVNIYIILNYFLAFWDPDEVYFNREGFDKHGGYYDDNGQYIPGEGWDDYNNCYFDEDPVDDFGDEIGDEGDIDDMYDNINEDDIIDETNYIAPNAQIEKINVDSEEVAQMEAYEKNQEAYNNQWDDGYYNYEQPKNENANNKPKEEIKPKEEPKPVEENKPKEEEKKEEKKNGVRHCTGLDNLFASGSNNDSKTKGKGAKNATGNRPKKISPPTNKSNTNQGKPNNTNKK